MTTTIPEQTVLNIEEKTGTRYTPASVDKPIHLSTIPTNTPAVNQQTNVPSTPVGAAVTEGTTTSKVIEDAAVEDFAASLKLQDKEKKKVAGAFTAVAITACLCGSSFALIAIGIGAIIPLLQLIIGLKYADECPVQWRIPHYLVVAGAVGLGSILLALIEIFLGCCGIFQSGRAGSVAIKVARGIAFVVLLLTIFTFGWFIAGCVWVFSVWNEVQYKVPAQSNYCKSTAYRFAYWLLFLSIIYHLITCCRSCGRLRGQKSTKKRAGLIPVPTSEP